MNTGHSTSNMESSRMRDLEQIVREAIKPVVDQVTAQAIDLKSLAVAYQDLRLQTARRDDVYDRAVMDEKLAQIRNENTALRAELQGAREFWWKLTGGAAAVITAVVLFAQHIHIS